MNQKERMLLNLPYKAWLDGLREERLCNKKKIFKFNHLKPGKTKKKIRLLKSILGKTGDNVWIGGSSSVMPGVTIGNNVVIGAGSVVTKDIPDNSIAVGNPCRVLRTITEADRDFYFNDRKFDVEDYK